MLFLKAESDLTSLIYDTQTEAETQSSDSGNEYIKESVKTS